MLKLWDAFLEKFKSCILLDQEKGYIYIRSFLWYSNSKLPEDKQPVLEKIITKHLPGEDKKDIMRTIAQKYRDEGIQIGKVKGKLEGVAYLALISRSLLYRTLRLQILVCIGSSI